MSLSDQELNKPSAWEQIGIITEAKLKASLSGGKGGQNVNKVSTKVELYWTPEKSLLINEYQKNKITTKLSKNLSNEGELRLVCEEARSQLKNKEKVIEKLYKLLAGCFKTQKPRKATKPTKASVAKRLTGKTRRKETKQQRRRLDD